ncbi:major facilitator superfamily domain-containing protein [Fomitopsis serialis]|uniref:major facilitator superfamily domain-containing protein n=1 Tax=Fomitopsis serialis TaxID=139415 RepID=UPI002007FB4B|nr:major facilitator superfamily domain-containing protein [Neoantrodia serialis]KAH9919825.1 major facilitator superfamily domain-containing protein [Neoantrodia serialis]
MSLTEQKTMDHAGSLNKEERVAEIEDTRGVAAAAEKALEEKRLVRKLDMRIMPIACILYLFAYLDRSNLGNARLQGLPQDTLGGDPTGNLYGCFAIGWGACSSLSAAAFNFAGLVCARLGLGVFEAGFGPGIPLYMSLFYTKEEMGLRMAYWFGFAAVAGAFGGLIAFGSLAIERMNRGISGDLGRVVKKKHVLAAFLDWRIYAVGVIYFGANCALASISAFLPTIIATFGYTNAIAQILTVPPYAVAAVFLCLNSYVSDRIRGAWLHVVRISSPCLSPSKSSRKLGIGDEESDGIPMYMAIGQCGSILGSKIYPRRRAAVHLSTTVSCALLFLSSLVALVLSVRCRRKARTLT